MPGRNPEQGTCDSKTILFCPHCGTKLDSDAKFCKHCGSPVDRTETGTFKAREQEYAGKMIKCPACGEDIPSFTAVCPSCGHEIRGSRATNSVQELSYKLEHASSDTAKANLIRTFPIPNTREDILEFMILASTNIENSYQPEVSEAWSVQFEQAFSKAKIFYGDDPKVWECYNLYLTKKKQAQKRMEQEQKRQHFEQRISKIEKIFQSDKGNAIPALIAAVILLIIPFLMIIPSSISHMTKEHQLENLTEEVQTYIEDGNFEMARITANQIIDDSNWSDESRQKWDSIRESLLESITKQEILVGEKIYAGLSSKEVEGKNYSEIVDHFKQQGFTDIKTEKIEDLVTGWLTKDGEVENVTINGLSDFEKESIFEPDAKIVVFYHTFK